MKKLVLVLSICLLCMGFTTTSHATTYDFTGIVNKDLEDIKAGDLFHGWLDYTYLGYLSTVQRYPSVSIKMHVDFGGGHTIDITNPNHWAFIYDPPHPFIFGIGISLSGFLPSSFYWFSEIGPDLLDPHPNEFVLDFVPRYGFPNRVGAESFGGPLTSFEARAVPEPSTLLLIGGGLLGLVGLNRRRKA